MRDNKKVVIAILAIAMFSICNCVTAQEEAVNEAQIIKEAKEKLSKVKVAVQYRYVTDGQTINRSLDDVIQIFKETKADFIFQGWLTQQPFPDNYFDLPKRKRKKYELAGYSYEHLINAVSKVKRELPNVIFCGGTQFEFLYPDEVAGKHEKERRDKAWNMSLNPQKWGIPVTRDEAQCYWARRFGIIKKNAAFLSEGELKTKMRHYFPDITNQDFQEVFLKRIFRQIDAGADAIWIDMLYAQPAYLFLELTNDENHPAVRESYEAIWDVVDKIHEYGLKKDKYIYVITWVAGMKDGSIIVVPKTNVDIAMVSPSPNEILDKTTGKIGHFNEKIWREGVDKINKQLGIPIFSRIDYGGSGRSPIGVFSQELTQDEAKSFLMKADDFFKNLGITFIYPVHGGDMGRKENVSKLCYGKFNWYDSLAPEFDTYETIKKLAQSNNKGTVP